MNKGNGQVILELQGTKKDFVGAWIMRLFAAALSTITAAAVIWFGKLILASVMYLVNTLPPMQADVNQLKVDMMAMKVAQEDAKKAISVASEKAQKELIEAERRVKNEIAEQIKKGTIITNQNRSNNYGK